MEEFSFEQVENASNNSPAISIYEAEGQIRFNKNLFLKMDNPTHVSVFFDVVRNVVAFKPLRAKVDGAYKVYTSPEGGSNISGAKLMKRYRISPQMGVPVKLHTNGMFIAKLK